MNPLTREGMVTVIGALMFGAFVGLLAVACDVPALVPTTCSGIGWLLGRTLR